MVHACIIASAYQYEEPRPPRRGSHRPVQPPLRSSYPSLNDWQPKQHDVYAYADHASLPPFRHQHSPQEVGFVYEHPCPLDVGVAWQHGSSLLPARRSMPASHAFSMGRPSIAATKSFYENRFDVSHDHESPASSDTASPPPRFSRERSTAGSKVHTSLALIHQLNGRVPDQFSLEQSILESYARSAPQSAACQSAQKRCLFPDCTKISVSRGLCRGHGGGRRCHVPDCTKSAQSRSNFCWAHGGGQRCDVDGCMRSRKSKHFCVAHLDMETADVDGASPSASDSATTDHRTAACRKKASGSRSASPPVPAVRALPSLGQALSSASRSAPNLPPRTMKLHA